MATIPAKRFGTPDEFGATCAFLCSAHAGYITGQNILIDGGIFPGAFSIATAVGHVVSRNASQRGAVPRRSGTAFTSAKQRVPGLRAHQH